MNKELLFQLYCIHSQSGCEKKMRCFLRKQAKECGADTIDTDSNGNLLITKGKSDTYPCLAAHMDQVQDFHSKDFCVVEVNGDVLGWSNKMHSQQGLGADDKNGIFICLELLRRFPVIKVVFFVEEEIGGNGSQDVSLDFFKDCRFVIEPDRKGSSDLITSMGCGTVCSDYFISSIGYSEFGYRLDRGTFTDVANLVRRGVGISCLNLSCGYYNAHTDYEVTNLADLENCLNFVAHIVETCTDVYRYEYQVYDYGSCGTRTFLDWFGYSSKKGKKHDIATEYYDEDDYMYYYDGGYYDLDTRKMEELLKLQPDLTFEQILENYISEFYVSMCFTKDGAESQLSDIYYEVYDSVCNPYIHDEFWDSEDDDAGEPVFPDNGIKKAS